MKSKFLSIICASIIFLGITFVLVNTILAKDTGLELDKNSQESQFEFEKQAQQTRDTGSKNRLNSQFLTKEEYIVDNTQINERQKQLLERQREQARRMSEKTKEVNKQNLEKKDKESKSNRNDEGQDNSVDNLSEQITIGPEREKKIKDKCKEISNKISEHQNELKLKSEKRINKYNRVITRLESVSVKLAEIGVDVSTYNEYVTEVRTRVSALNDLIRIYIASLQADTTQLCTKDKAATELNTRKSDLKVIIAQDKAIRTYIKETIIPYLRNIKPQQPAQTEQDNTTNPTTTSPTTNTTPIQ